MKFIAQVQLVQFDSKRYKRDIDSTMQEIARDAAKSWLRTVLTIVPTWSRASRATFEALANDVGFNVTYGPVKSREDRLLLGLSTSNGGLISKKLQEYGFFYETDLRYLAYNELNSATPGPPPQPFGTLINPTPYRFLEAGRKDFESFAKNIKLPSASDYIKGVPI